MPITGIKDDGRSKRKAEARRTELLAEWTEKLKLNRTDILFSDYMREWIASERSIAVTTRENYSGFINNQLVPYFAEKKIKLCDLSREDIQEFIDWKLASSGVCRNTLNRYQAIIQKGLNAAKKRRMIAENPVEDIILPAGHKHIAKAYTDEQAAALLSASRGHRIEPVIVIALFTGMRRGEILGLRWQDIDLERKSLHVCNSLAKVKGGVIDKEPKTENSNREIQLPDELCSYMNSLHENQLANAKRMKSHYDQRWAEYVCVDELGNRLLPDYVTHGIAKICKANNLPKIKIHELRHTYATRLLAAGATMKETQELLGHSDYRTTANIYAHTQTERKQQLVNSIGSIWT